MLHISWKTANATHVSIETISGTNQPLGPVEPTGAQQVSPSESTTYILNARGPGGTGTASVRVTVIEPAAPPVAPTQATDEELFTNNAKEVYFDLNNAEIRPDQKDVVKGTMRLFSRSIPIWPLPSKGIAMSADRSNTTSP